MHRKFTFLGKKSESLVERNCFKVFCLWLNNVQIKIGIKTCCKQVATSNCNKLFDECWMKAEVTEHIFSPGKRGSILRRIKEAATIMPLTLMAKGQKKVPMSGFTEVEPYIDASRSLSCSHFETPSCIHGYNAMLPE